MMRYFIVSESDTGTYVSGPYDSREEAFRGVHLRHWTATETVTVVPDRDHRVVMEVHRHPIARHAADLLSEQGENPEYDRALCELVIRWLSLPGDDRDDVAAILRHMHDALR